MTFKELKRKVKEEQKQLALEIRRGKHLRKPSHRTDITKDDRELYYYRESFEAYMVERLSSEYRHYHIAYCTFFNNTPYGLIEDPSEKPNGNRIKLIKESWESEIVEVVCDSS